MDNKKVFEINRFVNEAYECLSFTEFLKLAIMKLHELVIYDSGMFFCAISRDCSFFKPYIGGEIETYYQKKSFDERTMYQTAGDTVDFGKEAYVYKASDYAHGIILIDNEPRGSFLSEQIGFHIVCVRIVHKGTFLGEIYLHRSLEKPDFTDTDLLILRLLQPHVSTIFSIIHTVTAVQYVETVGQPCTQKGMCMFDKELSLTGGNVSGIEMLKMTTRHGSSVLYHIKEHCLDIIDEEIGSGSKKVVFRSVLLKIQSNDIKVDIIAIDINSAKDSLRFMIVMEFINEGQILADYKFKFSKRETEVIDGLIQGKNNVHLAETLNLSENTVKTHIKNIYKKNRNQ